MLESAAADSWKQKQRHIHHGKVLKQQAIRHVRSATTATHTTARHDHRRIMLRRMEFQVKWYRCTCGNVVDFHFNQFIFPKYDLG